MSSIRWESLDAWLIFGNVLNYRNLSLEEIRRINPDFYRSGIKSEWFDKLTQEEVLSETEGVLKTKSWLKMNENDGITVCTMRYPPRSRIGQKKVDFDVYCFVLAPTRNLLQAYRDKNISWKEYEERYLEQISRERFLDDMIAVAQNHMVTVYCWEPSPRHCHRRLIAEESKRRNPSLKVIIK